MNIKNTSLTLLAALAFSLSACNSSDGGGNLTAANNKDTPADPTSSGSVSSGSQAPQAIDYSLGKAMNARIGKGINMGNTFDGTCESCWGGGPVELSQVQAIAAAGFTREGSRGMDQRRRTRGHYQHAPPPVFPERRR